MESMEYYRNIIREELAEILNNPDESEVILNYDRLMSRLNYGGRSAYAVLMDAALSRLDEAEEIYLKTAGMYALRRRSLRRDLELYERRFPR